MNETIEEKHDYYEKHFRDGWKWRLGYMREVGPDEPRFDKAVAWVWKYIEELEKKLQNVSKQTEN